MGKCYIHLAKAFMVMLIIIHITNAEGGLFVCLLALPTTKARILCLDSL
jgi:hypothetical protein